MKAASKRIDGRLNDAFLAAVAGGLDRYHRTHGVTVDQLRMTMPINVRPKGDVAVGGNQFVPVGSLSRCRSPIPSSGWRRCASWCKHSGPSLRSIWPGRSPAC